MPQWRQRLAPGNDLAEKRVEHLGLMRTGSEFGEVFKIGEQRESDVGPYIGHLQLTSDQPEVFGMIPNRTWAMRDYVKGFEFSPIRFTGEVDLYPMWIQA